MFALLFALRRDAIVKAFSALFVGTRVSGIVQWSCASVLALALVEQLTVQLPATAVCLVSAFTVLCHEVKNAHHVNSFTTMKEI